MILFCDFTPRVPVYNNYLLEALLEQGVEYKYLTNPHYKGVVLANSIKQRIPKAGIIDKILTLINNEKVNKIVYYIYCWFYVLIYCFIKKNVVLHFQWLPLFEKYSIELYLLRLLKNKKNKIIYTVHNIIPHNSTGQMERYIDLYRQFDQLICHTKESISILEPYMKGYNCRLVHIPHGVIGQDKFRREYIHKVNDINELDKIKILQFGFFSYFKGLDILLEAASKCTNEKIAFRAIGKLDEKYKDTIFKLVSRLDNVSYRFEFIEEEELFLEIQKADILVFPYRNITQSGALLTALSSGKIIISSELKPFVELLENRYIIFKNQDKDDLLKVIDSVVAHFDFYKKKSVDNSIFFVKEYSWYNIAQKTKTLYKLDARE